MNEDTGIRIVSFDDWILDLVEYRFRVLHEFASNIEKWTETEGKRFRTLIEEEAKCIEDEELRAEFFEWHGEQVSVYENAYPFLNRSLVVAKAYFIFENELKALVRKLEKRESVSYKQFKRKQSKVQNVGLSEIEYLSDYLKDIAKVDIPKDVIWQEIQAIRIMRNAIAHNDFRLSVNAKLAIRNTKYMKCLTSDSTGRIVFPENIYREVMETFLSYFKKIEEEMNKKGLALKCMNQPQIQSYEPE